MSEQLFKPSCELTFDTVQADSQRFLGVLQNDKTTRIRFDLASVSQCDSAGLALLIDAKRLCKQHHKELIIEGMPQTISTLAEFCGVEAMLESSLKC